MLFLFKFLLFIICFNLNQYNYVLNYILYINQYEITECYKI